MPLDVNRLRLLARARLAQPGSLNLDMDRLHNLAALANPNPLATTFNTSPLSRVGPSSYSNIPNNANAPEPSPLGTAGESDTNEINRIILDKQQRADSVAGFNANLALANKGSAGAFSLVPGGLGSLAFPKSGYNSGSEYSQGLNDTDKLSRLEGHPLAVRANYNPVRTLGSKVNSAEPNWDTPGEVGGKNKAARMVEQEFQDERDKAEDNRKLAWNRSGREDALANANIMRSNAETLKTMHPNFTFHNVDGKVTAVDPSNPNNKYVLGDASMLSDDALEQKKQLAQWNQEQISQRQQDVNAAKVTPEKPVNPATYQKAHDQALQEVVSDPTNAGMFTDIVNQPDSKSPHPAQRKYSLKDISEINTNPANMNVYSGLLQKVSDRANQILGKKPSGDIELPSENNSQIPGNQINKSPFSVEEVGGE